MRQHDYTGTDPAQWSAVDNYFAERLAPTDEALHTVLQNNHAAGMPAHDVSPVQGKLLALLVRMTGAKRVLEIGTLGAYSTIWMARALAEGSNAGRNEGGKVVTIEKNPQHAEVARRNLALAGMEPRVELHVGSAADVLAQLQGPFDLIFIDADKPSNPVYLEWALRLSRPGTVIVGDNVVRGGAVVDAASTDPNVQGVRRFLDMIATEPRLDSTALQTVGEKGWDGFSLSVVKA